MDNKVAEIAAIYKKLQAKTCAILEKADGKGEFSIDNWTKSIGSGVTRVMQNGEIIEKGAVNSSHVKGAFSKEMEVTLGYTAETYEATGISSIIHAHNPFVPTIHMNVRYFSLNTGVEWFGGGIDLTPNYINPHEAEIFHSLLKEVCDKYNPKYYPEFKKWADDYFFISHRNETRGIGGIFFDRQVPDNLESLEKWINLTSEITELYPVIYSSLMGDNANKKYTQKQKDWQKLRRGRYVEFNLIYDKGTKFGFESGGNTESILVSMPSEARWNYKHEPEKGSEEERTLRLLKKGVEWIEK